MNDIGGSKQTSIHQLLRGADPEIRAILLTAYDQGFRVDRTKSSHYKVTPRRRRATPCTVFVAATPSEYRGLANTRSKLRGIGVRFDKS
jgi:hypothetical protein